MVQGAVILFKSAILQCCVGNGECFEADISPQAPPPPPLPRFGFCMSLLMLAPSCCGLHPFLSLLSFPCPPLPSLIEPLPDPHPHSSMRGLLKNSCCVYSWGIYSCCIDNRNRSTEIVHLRCSASSSAVGQQTSKEEDRKRRQDHECHKSKKKTEGYVGCAEEVMRVKPYHAACSNDQPADCN